MAKHGLAVADESMLLEVTNQKYGLLIASPVSLDTNLSAARQYEQAAHVRTEVAVVEATAQAQADTVREVSRNGQVAENTVWDRQWRFSTR